MKAKLSLTPQILLALTLGLILGPFWVSPLGWSTAFLDDAAKAVIQLVKLVAAPLLFFAIIHAITQTNVGLKNGLKMARIATINALIALCIGLALTNALRPGDQLRASLSSGQVQQNLSVTLPQSTIKKIELSKTFQGLIPSSWVQPWLENNILSLVILALLFGFALRKIRVQKTAEMQDSFKFMDQAIESLYQVLELILSWVVRLTPIAVFAAVTKSVAEFGFSPLKGLAAYLVVGLGGLLLHVLITYQIWIKVICKMPLTKFWKEAKTPVIYSIGANSSLATLPLTLQSLDRLGVSRASSALGACVGTNLNNDGIILYEAMALLFVAQALGMDLSVSAQIAAAFTCLVAAMGVAGVPEAGFISLSIILTTLGMPTELLPLLLTVDWILARARSATNVLSDMVVSIGIDHGNLTKAALLPTDPSTNPP